MKLSAATIEKSFRSVVSVLNEALYPRLLPGVRATLFISQMNGSDSRSLRDSNIMGALGERRNIGGGAPGIAFFRAAM